MQRHLDVVDLVIAAQRPRLAVEQQHAQVALDFDAQVADIVFRQGIVLKRHADVVQAAAQRLAAAGRYAPLAAVVTARAGAPSSPPWRKLCRKRFTTRPCGGMSTRPLATALPSTARVAVISLAATSLKLATSIEMRKP